MWLIYVQICANYNYNTILCYEVSVSTHTLTHIIKYILVCLYIVPSPIQRKRVCYTIQTDDVKSRWKICVTPKHYSCEVHIKKTTIRVYYDVHIRTFIAYSILTRCRGSGPCKIQYTILCSVKYSTSTFTK